MYMYVRMIILIQAAQHIVIKLVRWIIKDKFLVTHCFLVAIQILSWISRILYH